MECSFVVGQKVVCVDTWSRDERCAGDERGPIRGVEYTIREVGYLHAEHPNTIQVRLVEIVNPARAYGSNELFEPCFRASRFRPLVTRKTDISCFTAILNGHRISEDA
jgi:hypothetical protein